METLKTTVFAQVEEGVRAANKAARRARLPAVTMPEVEGDPRTVVPAALALADALWLLLAEHAIEAARYLRASEHDPLRLSRAKVEAEIAGLLESAALLAREHAARLTAEVDALLRDYIEAAGEGD